MVFPWNLRRLRSKEGFTLKQSCLLFYYSEEYLRGATAHLPWTVINLGDFVIG